MRVGFIGWRGMVGSVLLDRMRQEGDFAGLDAVFFSTSSAGAQGPPESAGPLQDAFDVAALGSCEVLLSCQGGAYTKRVFPELQSAGYRGLWIDASSALRMDDASTLVLDPVNGLALREALRGGKTIFSGSNCTVSLLVLGLLGLLRSGEVEWVSTMTYQAASGAGARSLKELVTQMGVLGTAASPGAAALEVDRAVSEAYSRVPTEAFGAPLAGSALPWIDTGMESGQTREEWKAQFEAARLLGFEIPIDGICVRIGALRSHAQALTLKLRREVPLADIEALLDEAHPWTSLVPNTQEATLKHLTPAAVSGTLQVPIGRVRPMTLGPTFISAFTVGDQLLWGAAEPLRRLLAIVREEHPL